MRLVSTVVDRVGVCDEEVCGVQVEYNPSRPASLSRPKRAAASAALQAIGSLSDRENDFTPHHTKASDTQP